MVRFGAAIVLGILVCAALVAINLFVLPPVPVDAPWAHWSFAADDVMRALLAVALGFVAGWCAARRGLAVGAILGVVLALTWSLYARLTIGAAPLDIVALQVASTAVAGIITQSVAGAAGEFFRCRRAPLTIHSSGRSSANAASRR